MISDPWTDKLSEYLDGELSESERLAMERHLVACPACTTALAALLRVVERARTLPDRPPVRDLWTGIANRIAEAPSRSGELRTRSWRWTFSIPQLVAAALAIAVVSGGGVWLTVRQPAVPATAGGVAPAAAPLTPPILPAVAGEARYDAAVADLQRVLDAGRGTLDTTTVRIIEKNLAVIDRAIADARRALAADPGNAYLNAYLARTMRRKIDILRQAATIVVSRS
ncbi:MAG TPA: zf-HC2 domain-containing protein [Gemmatimonadales bacterium]|nr:zf-HC2 domain-containing protein [Gemmatimonadales bacterium]